MECPYCQHSPINESDKHCPECGRLIQIASGFRKVISVRQEVKENRGHVVGIKTGAIHGDVFADTITHVEVYALQSGEPARGWDKFVTGNTPPYRSLSPYTFKERDLFYGREAQRQAVITKIAQQPLLALYGPQGVGKTSLLAAGVIPELTQFGALALRLQDYTQPITETIYQALAARADTIDLDLPQTQSLFELVRSVTDSTEATLALVLDEFESVFHPAFDPALRTGLLDSLAETVQHVDPLYFRVVIAVDSLDQLGGLTDRVPGLGHDPLMLKPLTRGQAESAILKPLEELRLRQVPVNVSYDEGFVKDQLVLDLDELSSDAQGFVYPPHLQIVCHRLYDEAAVRFFPKHSLINEKFYDSLGSAEGILYSHVDEKLKRFETRSPLARQILEAMLLARLEPGVAAEQLVLNGATAKQKRDLMDGLVEARLLNIVSANGHPGYAFSSPVVRESVRRQASPEVRRLVDSSEDLERAWSAWVAHKRLARRSELHYLAQAGDFITPRPDQVLLLLRSALARHQAVEPWLRRLADEEARALISQLDKRATQDTRGGRQSLNQARRLLGLAGGEERDKLPPRPAEAKDFGDVAWSAARNRSALTRQTAALALAATEEEVAGDAVRPLEDAVSALRTPWRRWQRRAELLGVLSDADEGIAAMRRGVVDRGSIWLWRFWRRVRADWGRIVVWSIGGALGAGLGLGLLRMVIALFAGDALWGVQFQSYSYQGLLLGLMLCLGMALADALLLRPIGAHDSPPQRAETQDELGQAGSESIAANATSPADAPAQGAEAGSESITAGPATPADGAADPQSQQDLQALGEAAAGAPGASRGTWLRPVVAVALGTLFFGGAHLLQALATNLFPLAPELLLSLGFLFGLGLSLALYNQPYASWHLGTSRRLMRAAGWLLRLGAVAADAVLTQVLFDRATGIGVGITIAWTSTTYESYGWPSALGLVDAALVGIVLTIGITAGLVIADRQLRTWRDRANRAGD